MLNWWSKLVVLSVCSNSISLLLLGSKNKPPSDGMLEVVMSWSTSKAESKQFK